MKMSQMGSSSLSMLVGIMAAGALAFKGPPKPDHSKPSSRRQSWRERKRRIIAHNMQTEQFKVIQRMTNWQRNQWNRAGQSYQMDDLLYFANLPHHKAMTFEQAAAHYNRMDASFQDKAVA